MKIRSLSTRIALLLGAATVLILGAAAVAMDHMVDAEMGQRFDVGLLAQARALAALADVGPNGLQMEDTGRSRSRLLTQGIQPVYMVACIGGGTAVSHPAPTNAPPNWRNNASTQPAFATVGVGEHTWRAVWFLFDAGPDADAPASAMASAAANNTADPCSVLFMESHAELDDILTDIDGILLLTPALALLAVLLLSPVLVRRGLRPLVVLGEEMRGIGPQAVGQRLHVAGTRELKPLVARFNEVLARMDEGVTRERQFAGALAHETRTRLAELRALVEVEQSFPGGRPVAELLDEIGNIGGELESTVSGLLLLTRLDAGIEDLAPARVDLDELVTRQLERVATTLHQRHLRVDRDRGAAHTSLVADPALLDIVIGNVLRNASAYAPAGSVIAIEQAPHALLIGNAAPDLGSDEVARFGQRFWSKHHRAEGHAGLGLGLALAGAAAEAMGLRLEFSLDSQQHLHARLSWGRDSEVMHVADAETAR